MESGFLGANEWQEGPPGIGGYRAGPPGAVFTEASTGTWPGRQVPAGRHPLTGIPAALYVGP